MTPAQWNALAMRRAGWPWPAIYLATAHQRSMRAFDPALWATICDIIRRDAIRPCRCRHCVGGRTRREWA